MHILLSGASGFLGSACVDLLRRFPEIELSVVRSSRVECVLPLGSREITLLDPTDYSALEKGLGARTPTHIMHLGGVSSPSACEQDPTLAYRGNVEFTKTLVRYAKQTAAHISLVSTDLVCDGARAPPGGFDETATPLPLSHYSRSKVAAEVETLSYHKGCVVRLALLYGHSFSKSRGVLGWMEETLLAREQLILFIDEYRSPIHVADAASSLFEISRLSLTGVWHCGGPTRMSRVEFGIAIAETLGYNSGYIQPTWRAEAPSLPLRPEDVTLNSSKLSALLGFIPRPVREALIEE